MDHVWYTEKHSLHILFNHFKNEKSKAYYIFNEKQTKHKFIRNSPNIWNINFLRVYPIYRT